MLRLKKKSRHDLPRMSSNATRGQAVLVTALMIILFLAGLMGASLLSKTTFGVGVEVLQKAQAKYIARGAANWYLNTLKLNHDLTTAIDTNGNFARGTYEVTITNKQIHRCDIRCEGKVTGFNGQEYTHTIEFTARKLPSIFSSFAFYLGGNVSTLQLYNDVNPTTINGDVWANCAVNLLLNCRINGTLYYRNGSGPPTGSGVVHRSRPVTNPPATMPILDANNNIYETMMDGYDTQDIVQYNQDIANAASLPIQADLITSDLHLTPANSPYVCQNCNLKGSPSDPNIQVTGSGQIISLGDMKVGADFVSLIPLVGSTIDIIPNPGGTIELLSGAGIQVGSYIGGVAHSEKGTVFYSTSGDLIIFQPPGVPSPWINEFKFTTFLAQNKISFWAGEAHNCRFYVSGNTAEMLGVRYDGSNIHNSILLSRRLMNIYESANIYDSVLYLDDAGDAPNSLAISDAGTDVSGLVISFGKDSGLGGLRILFQAKVSGIVYHYAPVGTTQFYSSHDLRGSFVTRQFTQNWFVNNSLWFSTITHDLPAIYNDNIPDGTRVFEHYISVQRGTWREY